MRSANARTARRAVAGAALVCLAVLVTACSSSGSPAVSSASAPVSSATSSAAATGTLSAPATVPATSPTVTASAAGIAVYLAPGQDVNATPLYKPACGGYGCALSGDSTAFLYQMTWTTWSATEAVGTGTYKLDDCNPNCAAGTVYSVPTVVTLSQPVKVCSAAGAREFWSRASFTFPDGLPKALQGQNAPQNPWTFAGVAGAAQPSCSS
jgi:hypothetical protein